MRDKPVGFCKGLKVGLTELPYPEVLKRGFISNLPLRFSFCQLILCLCSRGIPKLIVFNHITTQHTWGRVIFQQSNTVQHAQRGGGMGG